MMKISMRNGVAAAAVFLAMATVACSGNSPTAPTSTTPTTPETPTTPTPPTPTPTPTPPPPTPETPPSTSRRVLPARYELDVVRTCASSSGCGTRPVPTPLFIINSTNVTQLQVRGFVQLNADLTYQFESVQRTDVSNFTGPDQTQGGGGVFTFTDTLISLTTRVGMAPGTMTINTDGTLGRFYEIPIEPPFQPQTIQVTETYKPVR